MVDVSAIVVVVVDVVRLKGDVPLRSTLVLGVPRNFSSHPCRDSAKATMKAALAQRPQAIRPSMG